MEKQRHLKSEKLSIILFLFLFLLYAVVYMTKNMFTSAMAVIVEEGFMTKSQTGLINAVFWLVYAPFQIVGGFLAGYVLLASSFLGLLVKTFGIDFIIGLIKRKLKVG